MNKNTLRFILSAIFTLSIASVSQALQQKCAQIVDVGYCWTGVNTVIADMSNGEKLNLGDLAKEPGKSALSIALAAKASNQQICYYRQDSAESVCQANRYSLGALVLGGSIW